MFLVPVHQVKGNYPAIQGFRIPSWQLDVELDRNHIYLTL